MNTILNHKHNINLFIAVGLSLALVGIGVSSILSSVTATPRADPKLSQNITGNKDSVAVAPLSAEAFPQYRQSEWHSAASPVTGSGLEMYRQSERTLIPAQTGLMAYQLSERTLVDLQAGMAMYLNSERTSIPIQFTPYQLSEWFGK